MRTLVMLLLAGLPLLQPCLAEEKDPAELMEIVEKQIEDIRKRALEDTEYLYNHLNRRSRTKELYQNFEYEQKKIAWLNSLYFDLASINMQNNYCGNGEQFNKEVEQLKDRQVELIRKYGVAKTNDWYRARMIVPSNLFKTAEMRHEFMTFLMKYSKERERSSPIWKNQFPILNGFFNSEIPVEVAAQFLLNIKFSYPVFRNQIQTHYPDIDHYISGLFDEEHDQLLSRLKQNEPELYDRMRFIIIQKHLDIKEDQKVQSYQCDIEIDSTAISSSDRGVISQKVKDVLAKSGKSYDLARAVKEAVHDTK